MGGWVVVVVVVVFWFNVPVNSYGHTETVSYPGIPFQYLGMSAGPFELGKLTSNLGHCKKLKPIEKISNTKQMNSSTLSYV